MGENGFWAGNATDDLWNIPDLWGQKAVLVVRPSRHIHQNQIRLILYFSILNHLYLLPILDRATGILSHNPDTIPVKVW